MLAHGLTFLAVAAVTGGNLLVRWAWLRARSGPGASPLVAPGLLIRLLRSWRLALGMLLLLTGMLGWSVSMSVWHLSLSYPAFGLSYLVTVFCAWWFLGETLTLGKLCGTIMIVIGLLLIVYTSGY